MDRQIFGFPADPWSCSPAGIFVWRGIRSSASPLGDSRGLECDYRDQCDNRMISAVIRHIVIIGGMARASHLLWRTSVQIPAVLFYLDFHSILRILPRGWIDYRGFIGHRTKRGFHRLDPRAPRCFAHWNWLEPLPPMGKLGKLEKLGKGCWWKCVVERISRRFAAYARLICEF